MRICGLLLPLLIATLLWAQDTGEPRRWVLVPYTPFEAEPLSTEAGKKASLLIEALREIDEQRPGLTWDSEGPWAFSEAKDAYGTLVRMGPAALSALLEHLDDERPTKLKVPGDDMESWAEAAFGGMYRRIGVPVPPTQHAEGRLAIAAFGAGLITDFDATAGTNRDVGVPEDHVVTVGDCCFAILGEVVNRPYQAIANEPKNARVFCSPTDDPRIARALRAVWGWDDPRQRLARSLQHDLHSVGDGAQWLQVSAAQRLATWFPKYADAVIANRVSHLEGDWRKDGGDTADLLRGFLEHGGRSTRLAWLDLIDPSKPTAILAVALGLLPDTPEPEALARVRVVFDESDELDLVLQCARRLPVDAPGVSKRLVSRLDRAEKMGLRGHLDWIRIMVTVFRADGARARAICRRVMATRHVGKINGLVAIHLAGDEKAALELAVPLLDDKGPLGGLPLRLEWDARRRRVCDFAAAVVVGVVKDARFDNDDDIAQRDEQIAALRELRSKR